MNYTPVLCAFALAASLHAEECDLSQVSHGPFDPIPYQAAEINLFQENYLDLSQMEKMEPTVKNLLNSDTSWAYRSQKASDVMVFVSEKSVRLARICKTEEKCIDSLFTIHLQDVYCDEFARLQKAGVLKGTAEQADSLINHILEKMNKYNSKERGINGCMYNPEDYRINNNDGKDLDQATVHLSLTMPISMYIDFLDSINYCSVDVPEIIQLKAKSKKSKINPLNDKAFEANGQQLNTINRNKKNKAIYYK